MWIINNFLAYGNLSEWSTKRYLICPIYNSDGCSVRLKHRRKIVYMYHHQFLSSNHSWRICQNRCFNEKSEIHGPPYVMSRDDILTQLETIGSDKFGKVFGSRKQRRNESELNWMK